MEKNELKEFFKFQYVNEIQLAIRTNTNIELAVNYIFELELDRQLINNKIILLGPEDINPTENDYKNIIRELFDETQDQMSTTTSNVEDDVAKTEEILHKEFVYQEKKMYKMESSIIVIGLITLCIGGYLLLNRKL